jgi:hypothetical protein
MTRLMLTVAVSSACSLGTWGLLGRASEEALQPQRAAPLAEDSSREVQALRVEVDLLARQVVQLATTLAQVQAEAVRAPQGPPQSLHPSAAPLPVSIAMAPSTPAAPTVADPTALESTPPPAAPQLEARTVSELNDLARAAEAQAEHRSAVQATVAGLRELEAQLVHGDTDGARAALAQAEQVVDANAAAQLQSARNAIDNENIGAARELIALAMMQAN